MNKKSSNKICLVAILKDEESFLDEWLLYHLNLGVDHFFLYDDDPKLPLKKILKPHNKYITVIPWYGMDKLLLNERKNQTKAYIHSVVKFALKYEWVTFIDADEFIVLREHETIMDFLNEFLDCDAVSLNWHIFGHNGYYENPDGLITSSLTRRMYLPSPAVKTFTRPKSIAKIDSPHFCRLDGGKHVDANKVPFKKEIYPGRTDRAHINHYQCRSFVNWMNRVKRGDVNYNVENSPSDQKWRLTEEACLRQFVTTVALNKNEYIDEYMLKFKLPLENAIKQLKKK